MLTLLSLLQTRRDWPGRVLAERLEVTERTVRRDVEHLRDLGYQITAIKGPDGGYRLDAGTHMPPLLFDDDQAVAVATALQVAAVTGSADGEAALRALSTVRQVLPSRLRHRIDALAFTALPNGDRATPTVIAQTLIEVSGVVRAREMLRFDYASVGSDDPDAEPIRKQVEPHHVVFHDGRWYLLAWEPDTAEWRTFRLDRMTPRLPSGPRFTPRPVPGGDVHAFIAGRFKGTSPGYTWPCTGTVTLNLPARRVTPFAPVGTVQSLDDDHCRLTLGSWSWIALAAAYARFDASISDVTPPELTAAFTRLGDRLTGVADSP
jgi:biotin operon repressor